jgi:Xaa-Pro dipeptidase
LENVKRLMGELEARGVDALVSTKNVRYLAGTSAASAVVISRGKNTLICPRLEFDRAKRESFFKDVRAFSQYRVAKRKGENLFFGEPWQLIGQLLKQMKARKVGLDGVKADLLGKLKKVHRASYLDMSKLVAEMRKVKSDLEIELIRASARLAVKGMQRAAELIEEGRTELEIAAEAEYVMRKNGSEGVPFATIVASGKNSSLPHATASKKRLRGRELIIVDLGAVYKGYASDMTRTFAIKPTPKQLKLIDIVKQSQNAALQMVREGARAAEIDKTARGVIGESGLESFYLHNTGHGLGLDIHEPPYLSPKSKDLLREGMVITVEPGVYVPRVGGARWEDLIVVKSEGYLTLTKF